MMTQEKTIPLLHYFSTLKTSGKKGFIPYLMAGYPKKSLTPLLLKSAAKAGASAIELGIPFSDPIADGPVLQKANYKALEAGISLDEIFEMVHEVSKEISVPILLMGYMNPFMRKGWKALAEQAQRSGVSGFIVADLPLEEAPEIASLLAQYQLGLSPLCASTTQEGRMKALGSLCSAFVYLIAVKGVTGVRESLSVELGGFIRSVRKKISKPLYLGFGLSSPEQVKQISPLVDGVIVGSRIAQFLEEHQTAFDIGDRFEAFLKPWIEVLESHGKS